MPAPWPRDERLDERLLHVDPSHSSFEDFRIRDLPRLLRAGDLLVVNDAATIPGSLSARSARGDVLELRLAGHVHAGLRDDATFQAVLFGAGDWRMRTEDRPLPPELGVETRLQFAAGMSAVIVRASPVSPRLVDVTFDADDDALWAFIYRHGSPVQYSYLREALPLWHVQTSYASRPFAFEPPSAGRPLTWDLLQECRSKGVALASLTHAAGLSATGDPRIDALLPLPERFDIPAATALAVRDTKRAGGRIVAVGTSVVRALEGAAALHNRQVRPGPGVTDLILGQGSRRSVVDGLLTGIHEPAASHFSLLHAFAPAPLVTSAYAHAASHGYLHHEFGDSTLVLRS